MSNPLEPIQAANIALLKRDWKGFEDAHTPDVHVFGSGVVDARGSDGLRAVFDMWVQPFPDLNQRLLDAVVDSSSCFARIEIEGTHTGPLPRPEGPPIPPSGKRFKTYMAAQFKVRDGKIAEVYEFINFADIYRQLGQNI